MSEEQIRRIIEDSYDESKEDILRGMFRDFYSRRMRSIAIMAWGWGAAFAALAVYSATEFFAATQTQGQIMFAALFILGAHFVGLMKIFAWGMIHRSSIRRDLKRLELRVVELSEMLKQKG
jgi:hypothetical protein